MPQLHQRDALVKPSCFYGEKQCRHCAPAVARWHSTITVFGNPNRSDEGRREWGIRGGEQSTSCIMPEARLALTVLFSLKCVRVITDPMTSSINNSCCTIFSLLVLHPMFDTFDEVSPPVPLDLGWDLERFPWPFALPSSTLWPSFSICLAIWHKKQVAEYVSCLLVEVAFGVLMQRTW